MTEYRTVYYSPNYNPDDVMKKYAKENREFEEGGWRVVEVNAGGQTIHEFVTHYTSYFKPDKLEEMKERADSRMFPSWTEL